MKDSGTVLGGSLSSSYINTRKTVFTLIFLSLLIFVVAYLVAQYLLKCVQAWNAKGFTAYAIGIQVNE